MRAALRVPGGRGRLLPPVGGSPDSGPVAPQPPPDSQANAPKQRHLPHRLPDLAQPKGPAARRPSAPTPQRCVR